MTDRVLRLFLMAMLFLSGVGALGAQVSWAKCFANGLGHEMPAVLAVMAAVMGGMALGAGAMDRRLAGSASPGLWYAGLEWVIALWGCAAVLVIPLINDAALQWIGSDPSPLRHWLMAFALPFAALLPATAAMGATLPAMDRWLAPLWPGQRCIGALYAANTAGAVSGALAAAFVALPLLGLTRTLAVFAQLNLLCGALAWVVAARPRAASGGAHRPGPNPANAAATATPRSAAAAIEPAGWRVQPIIFLTGVLGLGLETLVVRLLSQVLENTVYTYAVTLAVFLLANVFGAAAYQRWWRDRPQANWLGTSLTASAVACVLAGALLARGHHVFGACREMLGPTDWGRLAAETATAGLVLGLPAFWLGAVCATLLQVARGPDGGVGRALAWNTLGAALAPILFGVVLLPQLGGGLTWTLVVLGYGALALWFAPRRAVWAVVALALWAVWPPDLRLIRLEQGERLLAFRAGAMASVSVLEDGLGDRMLRVNDRFQMGGTAAAGRLRLQAHVPLLLHPQPRRALFLGTGTGITLGAGTLHPELECDGVELLPEVIELMRWFEPENFGAARLPRVRWHVADARRFVRVGSDRYDVIVADLFHPARDGAGTLYTVEHFRAMRARLSEGGLVCQWLPLYQLRLSVLRMIVGSFLEVFPDAQAWWLDWNADTPVLGLVGRGDGGPAARRPVGWHPQWIETRRPAAAALEADLKRLALSDSVRLFGRLAADAPALRRMASGAPLNTDDHPRVMFEAPRAGGEPVLTLRPFAELLAQWAACDVSSALGFSADAAAFGQRVARFRQARDEYVLGLVVEAERRPETALEHYIRSAELSPDFTAGYAQCLSRAALEAARRPAAVRAMLERLMRAQPDRPAARELYERLEGER